MGALKVIGLIVLGFMGFGILMGIGMAAKAVGFVLGMILIGLLIVGLLIAGLVTAVKKPNKSDCKSQ